VVTPEIVGVVPDLQFWPQVCDTYRVEDVRPWSEDTLTDLQKAMRTRRQRQGRALRVVGIVFLTASLAIGGYLAWLFFGTTITTNRAQGQLRPSFETSVDTKDPSEAPPADRTVKVPGNAVAILVIPRIDLNMVVVEGTDTDSLKKGPGHYSDTAYPWDEHGRVAIAGHRTTYGAPFWSLEKMREGDRITLQTEYGTYNYQVTRSLIIQPDEGWVLEQTRAPRLVLTTCNPRFSAAERLIVFAERVNG
jgi:sortase A